ncbi:MAG: glycosyltransferase family 4 protein [Myxococcota bacterium]|nr:glycosyltransferase family 4 protein [Myxococcota bacterium]
MFDAGFDVRIFTLGESPDWDKFEVLAGRDDVRARIHIAPPLAVAPRALMAGALTIARIAAANRGAFARFATHTWKHRHVTPMRFWKSLYARIQFVGHEIDVLHIEFDIQGLGFADLRAFLGCRVLLSARGTLQSYSADPEAMCDYLFRYADGVHFISQFLETNMRELGLPAAIPTWRIAPAIDLSLFHPASREPRAANAPLRLISVGRLSWSKGYEFALEAVAKVRAAGIPVEYTIYGGGSYDEAIMFAIEQLDLHACVRLAGVLRREDMPRVYGEADLMLHAALDEGFCNAVIEAQAMELAVVTTDSGGLPENVDDGLTGYVVPSRDSTALADRIVELARDPELRARFGKAGRERALARFDLDRQAEAFVRLYRELVELPRASSRAPSDA